MELVGNKVDGGVVSDAVISGLGNEVGVEGSPSNARNTGERES